MESATQVDLAKTEVPASQVVDSVLEEAADHLTVESTLRLQDSAQSRSPRRSIRGGSATTNQVRLKPKPADRSPSPSPGHTSADGLAVSNLEATRLAAELQPVDQGFGAWSYVASAFAMYIVVWGELQTVPVLASARSFTDFRCARLSTVLSDFSDIPVHRTRLEVPRVCRHQTLGSRIAGYRRGNSLPIPAQGHQIPTTACRRWHIHRHCLIAIGQLCKSRLADRPTPRCPLRNWWYSNELRSCFHLSRVV